MGRIIELTSEDFVKKVKALDVGEYFDFAAGFITGDCRTLFVERFSQLCLCKPLFVALFRKTSGKSS